MKRTFEGVYLDWDREIRKVFFAGVKAGQKLSEAKKK